VFAGCIHPGDPPCAVHEYYGIGNVFQRNPQVVGFNLVHMGPLCRQSVQQSSHRAQLPMVQSPFLVHAEENKIAWSSCRFERSVRLMSFAEQKIHLTRTVSWWNAAAPGSDAEEFEVQIQVEELQYIVNSAKFWCGKTNECWTL
jgi:hypothetical protein